MYSFLCVAPRSRASKKGREGIGRKSERSRRNEPFALFTREKRQKMRDVVEGKVNGARINILAWMEDDRGGRGGRQRKKEIEHELKRELRTSERKKVERNCATMVRTRVDFIRGRPS